MAKEPEFNLAAKMRAERIQLIRLVQEFGEHGPGAIACCLKGDRAEACRDEIEQMRRIVQFYDDHTAVSPSGEGG